MLRVAKAIMVSGLFAGISIAEDLRMNQIQVIGTHNSYHIAPVDEVLVIVGKMKSEWREALDYTHLKIPEQLERLGIRQFELDVFADPKGGLYSKPKLGKIGSGENDPDDQLDRPGMKVLHIQDLDFRTNVLTFRAALEQVQEWSADNVRHVPIMILVEVKDDQPNPLLTKPVPFDRAQLEALEAEIYSVFKKEQLILPDDVRGGAKTLREAVLGTGWPLLDSVRGKVMFALDNGGRIRDAYLKGNSSLEGRVMFAGVGEREPAAAFFKLNNPVAEYARIQRLVKQGFIVRTRADAGTVEARNNDVGRRDKALSSGAQFVSTDYPVADERLSDYRVGFKGGAVARANPVSGDGATVSE